MAESLFAALKVELAHAAQWRTRRHAQDEVFEYLKGLSRPAPTFRPRLSQPAGLRTPVRDRSAAPAAVTGREREGRRGARSHDRQGGRYLGIPQNDRPWAPRWLHGNARPRPHVLDVECHVQQPHNSGVYESGASPDNVIRHRVKEVGPFLLEAGGDVRSPRLSPRMSAHPLRASDAGAPRPEGARETAADGGKSTTTTTSLECRWARVRSARDARCEEQSLSAYARIAPLPASIKTRGGLGASNADL